MALMSYIGHITTPAAQMGNTLQHTTNIRTNRHTSQALFYFS